MVVQKESVEEEEDVEHFEDVKEEDDIDPNEDAEKEWNKVEIDQDGGKIKIRDGDSSSDDEEALAVRQSDEEDYASSDAEELFLKETVHELKDHIEVSNDREKISQPPMKSSCLPGGYDPRHREPSYCNGDRASWWELVVLSSHVHPSVATMAGTLLSGSTIVYNGNPLNDLALPAFLDKFMEKKAKQSIWHGGSQIEPSKKVQLDTSNHVIGAEFLSLAEEDVAPEDLVFHKFYVNKMNSTKTSKKKKKKLPEEDAAEELYDVNDGDGGADYDSDVEVEAGDESDNEEIENMLDNVDDDAVEEEGGEYDYDDLDRVAGDDEELLGGASDAEMDTEMDTDMDMLSGEDIDDDNGGADHSDDDDDHDHGKKKKKEKRKRKSPFASLEEYEDLIDRDDKDDLKPKRKATSEPKKKKKTKSSE